MAALSDAEVLERLDSLPAWRLEAGALRREYATDGWVMTMAFANAISFLAEASDHHPDLAISWGRLGVSLVTHSEGGITTKDLALATEIERLAGWRPAAGGRRRPWIGANDA